MDENEQKQEQENQPPAPEKGGGKAAPDGGDKKPKPSFSEAAAARKGNAPRKDTPKGGDTATDAGADKSEKSGSDGGDQPAGENKSGKDSAKPDKEKSKKGNRVLEPWVKERFGKYRGQIQERDAEIANLKKQLAAKGDVTNAEAKTGNADDATKRTKPDNTAKAKDENMPERDQFESDEDHDLAVDYWVEHGYAPDLSNDDWKIWQDDNAETAESGDKSDKAGAAKSETQETEKAGKKPADEEKPSGPTRGELLLAEVQESLDRQDAEPEVYETFAKMVGSNEIFATDVVLDELLSLDDNADVIKAITEYPATFNRIANRFYEASEDTQKAEFAKFVEKVARRKPAKKPANDSSSSGPEVGDMSGTRAAPPANDTSLAAQGSKALFAARDKINPRRRTA